MIWSDYYEKINDWSVSTAVSKISSLEDMGAPDEIADALNIIAFEDEKGATRLLNRALQHGVKFSGENLAEIVGLCAEDSFKKALYQSADAFSAQDLENLYGCVDDELIIDWRSDIRYLLRRILLKNTRKSYVLISVRRFPGVDSTMLFMIGSRNMPRHVCKHLWILEVMMKYWK